MTECAHNSPGAPLPLNHHKSATKPNARKAKASRICEIDLANGKALGHESISFEQNIRAWETLASALSSFLQGQTSAQQDYA